MEVYLNSDLWFLPISKYFLNAKYFECLQISDIINITGVFFYRYLHTLVQGFPRDRFSEKDLTGYY